MFGNSSYSEAPYSAEGIDPNAEIVLTGASATGVVGTVSFILDQNLSPAGVSATGIINDVLVPVDISVFVTSLIGSSEITSSLVWGEIDQDQTPNWTEIKD
tara:strand:+ start:121 stop:423 length:303 start_codon:yes stop_codon:yes gene_type:complete